MAEHAAWAKEKGKVDAAAAAAAAATAEPLSRPPEARGPRKIDDALDAMAGNIMDDGSKLDAAIEALPLRLKSWLTSVEFTSTANDRFSALDYDNSGYLDAEELFPVLAELTDAQAVFVSRERLERLVAVFDTNHDGVISRGEFLPLTRAAIVSAYYGSSLGDGPGP
jgi:hypothetical protein